MCLHQPFPGYLPSKSTSLDINLKTCKLKYALKDDSRTGVLLNAIFPVNRSIDTSGGTYIKTKWCTCVHKQTKNRAWTFQNHFQGFPGVLLPQNQAIQELEHHFLWLANSSDCMQASWRTQKKNAVTSYYYFTLCTWHIGYVCMWLSQVVLSVTLINQDKGKPFFLFCSYSGLIFPG